MPKQDFHIRELQNPVEKLKVKKESVDAVNLKDLDFFLTKNVEGIETPEDIEETKEFLEDNDIIKIDGDEITEINKQRLEVVAGVNQETKPLMEENFPLEAYKGLNKTEIAQEYADWLINKCNIRPVWMGGTTLFYRLNKSRQTWEEVHEDKIIKKARKDLRSQFTSHTKRELMNQFEHHHKFIEFEDMGLNEDEVLLKDGKVLNLDSKELRDIEKDEYALNSINVSYNPDAESDGLKEFIEDTIDNEKMINTLQEYIGYTLTWPSNDFEKILLILGGTDTGKSTLINIIEEMYGEATITKLSFPQIGGDRAFNVSSLKDSVLNIDTDMEDQDIKRKSRVKKVVSKEEIFVEDKGVDGYNMTSYANHLVTSNNAPDDRGATDAYYNRFLTLTATSRIPEEHKDRQLAERLKSEENLQWLLNWAVEGLERLKERNDFSYNPSEYETKKQWDRFGNSVQKFISDQVTKDRNEGRNVRTTDLYECYELWIDEQIEDEVGRAEFISLASDHPLMHKAKATLPTGDRAMCFKDIKVKDYEI